MVKNPPANVGDARNVSSIPGRGEDPLEEEMATHSSIIITYNGKNLIRNVYLKLTQHIPKSFMLLQMALFHSILWLSNIPLGVGDGQGGLTCCDS